jgi:hypothetical protein
MRSRGSRGSDAATELVPRRGRDVVDELDGRARGSRDVEILGEEEVAHARPQTQRAAAGERDAVTEQGDDLPIVTVEERVDRVVELSARRSPDVIAADRGVRARDGSEVDGPVTFQFFVTLRRYV